MQNESNSNRFPSSMFPEEVLMKTSADFNIAEEYYKNLIKPRNPRVVTKEELDNIRGDLDIDMEEVIKIYQKMTPFDSNILGARLPTKTLAEMLKITGDKAHALKHLCNILRDMSEEEYKNRLSDIAEALNVNEMTERIRDIQQYFTAKNIMKIPRSRIDDFLNTPMFIIRRLWRGPRFKALYKKAVEYYKHLKGE